MIIDNWEDISDEEIESAILTIINGYSCAHIKSLGMNILAYHVKRLPPDPGDTPHGRRVNIAWQERFQERKVIPVIEKMIKGFKVSSDCELLYHPCFDWS